MARIVSNFFISLDGVVEAPNEWHFPYFDDAMGRVIGAGMESQSAFLLGHNLYREWAEYWPQAQDPFAGYINPLPKYVLAHEDFDAQWQNTSVISGRDDATVAEGVRGLKETLEGTIGMSGSATTVRWLLAHGLLDELALLVHPIAVSKGQRLFEGTGTVPLKLVHHETLPTGVLHVRYTPA